MKNSKKNNKIKCLIGISCLIMAITSCKKLIEIPPNPKNEITSAALFADSANIAGALAGIYDNFGVTTSLDFGSGAITLYTGLTGDELVPIIAGGSPNDLQFYSNNIINTNNANSGLWSNAYKALYQVNACLAGISATNVISDTYKKQLIGEIEVVRAFYYFNLVNVFGPVPFVNSTNYLVTKTIPRAPVDTIYNQILKDLTDAQKKLTVNYPSDGHARPNLFTADALLAKVYLYLGQWQNAENAANSVINSNQYSLVPLSSVFLDGSAEAIWQLPGAGLYNQTEEAQYFVPYASTVVPNYSLSGILLKAFEPGDQRLQQWAGENTVNINGVNMYYYYPHKYKAKYNTDVPAEDYMIFRLGELYLIRAEALAEENKIAPALADLNQLRSRAGLPGSTAASQKELLTAIMHERQIELFCEWGNRWYDLKRTGTINTVLGSEKTGWVSTDASYPVPLIEIQANPFLTQNPGYN